MAEVLITLGIIGVVAALTIPTMIGHYQKKEYETRLVKAYSTLYNGIKLMMAEEDVNTIKESSFGKEFYLATPSKESGQEWKANVAKYFKVADSDVGVDGTDFGNTMIQKYKLLNGSPFTTYYVGQGPAAYIRLTDDTIFWVDLDFQMFGPYLPILIDTNGVAEPNTLGRDLFVVYLVDTPKGFQIQTYTQTEENEKYSDDPFSCGTIGSSKLTGGDDGFICFDRIVEENWKMNY